MKPPILAANKNKGNIISQHAQPSIAKIIVIIKNKNIGIQGAKNL